MKFNVPGALVVFLACVCLLSPLALADTLSFFQQGGILPDAPAYNWYYGCSPTAAGMMMGFYDRNGYGGYNYTKLVPGGTAELSSWSDKSSSVSPLADRIIASPGHIHDFYNNGQDRGLGPQYLDKGDDVKPDSLHSLHSFDSLGDFMGTSQDNVGNGNQNGVTTFYYDTTGARFTAEDAIKKGNYWQSDGMFGMAEYFKYAGYTANLSSFFTQPIYTAATPYGFTFTDYMAEINAGRVMMIQLRGHSMFGYGYDANNTINFYDTWTGTPQTMIWGESYKEMQQWAVTGFTPAGGEAPVPEPGTLILLSSGCLGFVLFRKMRA
jgi:hypothetical protein